VRLGWSRVPTAWTLLQPNGTWPPTYSKPKKKRPAR